ncbi:GNAT family N-acetyltransferase [Paenibacillus endoradicis]|uniref:GNAT family N-acetyltransferase n=1 Tax=Paenibacillus endoradicis TaxID=2972487 RepID=UPI00215932E1|nr:GNAT family N-acetyltransferase [Paenibacillus endoradicis]MCR8657149.1 GNAT family N-acetyltransferase [Paenibacillus endoradicis]
MINTIELIELIDESQIQHEFLFSLFVSTLAVEMAAWGWSNPQALLFLSSQYDIQQRSYKQQFRNLKTYMMFQAEQTGSIRIVNLIITSNMQGLGIGTSVLRFLQRNAGQQHKSIDLSVENTNHAKQWYIHLGFAEVSVQDWNSSMSWYPEQLATNCFIEERFEVRWNIN